MAGLRLEKFEKKRFPPLPGLLIFFAVLAAVYGILLIFPARVVYLTDPAWEALFLPGGIGDSRFLKERLLHRITVQPEGVEDLGYQRVFEILRESSGQGVILSPLLSHHAARLKEDFPEKGIAFYSHPVSAASSGADAPARAPEPLKTVRIHRERREAMAAVGKAAVEYLMNTRDPGTNTRVELLALVRSGDPGAKEGLQEGISAALENKSEAREALVFTVLVETPETADADITGFFSSRLDSPVRNGRFFLLFGGEKNSIPLEIARKDGVEYGLEIPSKRLEREGIFRTEPSGMERNNPLETIYLVEHHEETLRRAVRMVARGREGDLFIPWTVVSKER